MQKPITTLLCFGVVLLSFGGPPRAEEPPEADSCTKSSSDTHWIVKFKSYKHFAEYAVTEGRPDLIWYVPDESFLVPTDTACELCRHNSRYKKFIDFCKPLGERDILAAELQRRLPKKRETPGKDGATPDEDGAAPEALVCQNLSRIPDELLVRVTKQNTVEIVGKRFVDLLAPGAPAEERAELERIVKRSVYGPISERGSEQPQADTAQMVIDLHALRSDSKRTEDDVVEALRELLKQDVLRVDPRPYATLRNGATSWVIQSEKIGLRSIFDKGLRGKDEVIGLIDDFPDLGHCFFADYQSVGPCHRKIVRWLSRSGIVKPSRHGTLAAGILSGQLKDAPDDSGNGQAPDAKIAFAYLWDFAAPGKLDTTLYDTLEGLYAPLDPPTANEPGARVFSNSWGDDQSWCYSGWAYDIDEFTWEREDAVVIVGVSNLERIMNPETSKNALAVAASKQAGFHEEKGSGGHGPTRDGRLKPEILAPGCRIRSAAAGTACGIGGGPIVHEPGLYHYSGSNRHGTDCATSWAAPAVAGAAALVRQYYLDGYYPTGEKIDTNSHTPSGALLKATLLNATVDMTEVSGLDGSNRLDGSTYPNLNEGWGRLLLGQTLFFKPTLDEFLLDPSPRRMLMWDVRQSDPHSFALGDDKTVEYEVKSVDSQKALKVTLVWADPPPAPNVRYDPVVNDLNLVVERLDCPQNEKCLYIGNSFETDGSSCPFVSAKGCGVIADKKNNVEQVIIPNPPAGGYRISISASRIWVVKEPKAKKSKLGQGYALVASGAIFK